MSGVHFCSETNSTLFTDCCGTAICDDQYHCPKCKQEILLSPRERWNMAMLRWYGAEKLREMRQSYKER